MAPNNIHTIHSSPNPDTQARTFRDRYCPGMTRLWYLNPAKFDPRNRARDDAIRRYCMIVTFLGHTALDIIALFKLVIGFNIIGFIVSAIMSVIFFGFLCWALPTIGDAEGERVVLGKNVVSAIQSARQRQHVDNRLGSLALRCLPHVLRRHVQLSSRGRFVRDGRDSWVYSGSGGFASVDLHLPRCMGCDVGLVWSQSRMRDARFAS